MSEATKSIEPLKRGCHWYVVYDKTGAEVAFVQAHSKLEADVRGAHLLGDDAFGGTAYTER
jgi:hypothetical protein